MPGVEYQSFMLLMLGVLLLFYSVVLFAVKSPDHRETKEFSFKEWRWEGRLGPFTYDQIPGRQSANEQRLRYCAPEYDFNVVQDKKDYNKYWIYYRRYPPLTENQRQLLLPCAVPTPLSDELPRVYHE